MATVRTPTPRGSDAGNKRKRKRPNKPKTMSSCSASSTVDTQLQSLESWQRALTIDIRELRREGARVRIELEKVDDTAEAAVEKAEKCAAVAQSATKARDEAVKETQNKLQNAEKRHNSELEKLNKRLGLMDKKLERHKQSSINEEFLMAQLTELQEQYENELTKVREDHDAALETQQKQLQKMERVMMKMQEEQKKQAENVERVWREENSRLVQKLKQLATRQEMFTLQQQFEAMERDNHDEQGRTRVDLNNFEDKLVDLERRVADMDLKVQDVDKKVDDVGTRPAAAAPTLHQPPLPPLPPVLPRDLVRQGELARINDELRRISRDFHAVGADMASMEKRVDARRSQQEHHFEARVQDLSTQVFDALGHDSRQHATEIGRLKDALFDVQGDNREFGQRMRRLEGDMQQAARAQPPQRSCEGPGWRYRENQNQNQQAVLPTPPLPPSSSHRNRRERPSRYEPAPDTRDNNTSTFEPPAQDRIRWAPRRTSPSRSPRNSSWGATGYDSSRRDLGSGTAQNDRQHQRNDQQYNPASNNGGDRALTRNVTELSRLPPSLPTDSTQSTRGDSRRSVVEGTNQEDQADLPFRRNRQPRRTPEVIVIEEDDDDDDDDDDIVEENSAEEQEDIASSRAPPDVVLDEDETPQSADVVMVDPPGTTNAGHVETTTDLLENEPDLQTGFLLYFCLGGAPDLDAQWTNCFTQLHADECVEMPRALRFQRRYGFLQNFPVYLTQCILQAVIVNGQNAPEGNAEPSPIGTLNVANMRVKFDDMVKDTHLSWAKALVEHLSKQARDMDELAAEKLELAVNPAGLSSSGDDDNIIYDWSRRQESVMWVLARKLHYGSFLPAMKCNVDASPAVYLFTFMFDVLVVTSECPQFGTFRLNAMGAKILTYLWNYTLKKLPYVFFADWSWLEDQSTKKHLPALAFCHLLVSILLWNSAIDRHSLTNRNVYAAAVKHVFPKLYVGGKAVHEFADSSSLLLGECESTRIELLDLDNKFASMLGLDGFFEVTEAIQNNMLAVAAAAKKNPASST